MENEIIIKQNLIDKIIGIIKKRKKLLILLLSALTVVLLLAVFFNSYQNNQNQKISEQYIKANIFLSSKDKEKSKIIYKEIIFSKNKFYSILALNSIIENNLEKNTNEVLRLFAIVEDTKISFKQKNLIKLKKALYLKKILKDKEGNKLLKEIIADESIWKETALEILKQ